MTDRQRYGFVLILVIGLIAASAVVLTQFPTRLGLDLKGGTQLVYQGTPTPQTPHVTQDTLNRAVNIMRDRVDQLGVAEPEIQTSGDNEITVGLPDVQDTSRAEKLVGSTAQLDFYDWEANVLTPSGKPAADGLQTQDPSSLTLSCGSTVCNGSTSPGFAGGGSMSLYDAVKLASKQPPVTSANSSHIGNQYYMFGAPGWSACQTAAKFYGVQVQVGQHCYLSGPDDNPADLASGLPPGVTAAEGETLIVPPGTVVLQAADQSSSHQTQFTSPDAQFYVLKDNVSVTGNQVTNPQQSTDSAGTPDVTFGFTSKGNSAFQKVTGEIAHRGELDSIGQTSLNQHFAVALDNKLITVPQIDYHQYPDGIVGGNGAEITGGFTNQSAQDLATQLRLGALPIGLKLISESQVSATLGKQALHQGLLAGAIGLLVVAVFLLLYYRILGLIAVAGLAVYSLYFYALIKLIPVTLTLPGIAGLILTIGVAADANVVIFERVKEEIRGGRSIRQGITIGYRKGLTAIIDANVVTIMTAFILFVLATSEVQGFAFTLGIGTFVSLFTAVMATQAILMTMSGSRMIARPSALGAGGKKHVWKFDFMGASRYFFSMSGVILLIGALAIGGKGLNLGIDFTSGTRITASLEHPASQAQVSSIMNAAGASNATIQKITNKELGPYVWQISSKQLQPGGVEDVKSSLDSKFGLKPGTFSSTSVGPTFGKTVANSAVVAIIASLLVISVYVALRFEWKFAIPVLIALMHDLLITSGVYALTGRVVTTATVAALLTILGYSLYDTIIVFDRVRENVPRMPRAAFSQIVNRSMSEVLTRSIVTTSCTLMPILALLLFGGGELKDFAFALLIGVASGAYSSIFIASPVLTHWKERESQYRARRQRIEDELGMVPAYATTSADIEPVSKRPRRAGRLTTPEAETISAAEFEQMKRDIAEEERERPGRTSTLTKRLAHTAETETAPPRTPPRRAADGGGRGAPTTKRAPKADGGAKQTPRKAAADSDGAPRPDGDGAPAPAPDVAENEGMVPAPKDKGASKSRSRNRRHGRRR